MQKKNVPSKLNRGLAAYLFLLAVILILFSVFSLTPVRKIFLIQAYIDSPEQLDYAAVSALRAGIIAVFAGIALFFVGYFLLLQQKIRITKSNLAGFITLCLTLIVFGFIAENFLREILPRGDYLYYYKPGLIYDLKPGAEGKYEGVWYKINRQGFRGNEIDAVKAESEVRYFFLGNSITFGYGIPTENNYTSVLEKELNSSDTLNTYRNINLAVSGYNLTHCYYRLQNYQDFHFDRLFVGFCFNDFISEIANVPGLKSMTNLEDTPERTNKFIARFKMTFLKSHFGYFFDRGMRNLLSKITGVSHREEKRRYGDYMDRALVGMEDKNTEYAWEKSLARLDSIKTWSDGRNIPMTLLIFPESIMLELGADSSLTNYPAKHLIEWADSRGVDYLDFIRIYRSEGSKIGIAPEDLNYDKTHPSVEGHQIIAKGILNYLKSKDQGIAIRE